MVTKLGLNQINTRVFKENIKLTSTLFWFNSITNNKEKDNHILQETLQMQRRLQKNNITQKIL